MRSGKSSLLVVFGVIILFASFVSAETMPSPMADSLHIQKHVGMLKDSLSLTDSQTQQIQTILAKEDKQMVSDRMKYSTDTKAMQKARTNLRGTTDKEIKAVLTKDQQQKYERIEKQMHKNEWNHRQEHTTPKTK
jgi:Spy/CpxP family protein refolding chaperone